MKFINIQSLNQPLSKKREIPKRQAFIMDEKALRPKGFDPNATDGDGDGRVQDNTPFERPSIASGGVQQRLGEIVRSTPEDKVKDYSSFMTEAELRDAAKRRGVNPNVYFDPALDEQDVEDATSKWSLGKTGRQNATDAVIVRQGDNGPEVLMIERKFGPFRGSAALPGGLVDLGESFEDAADREMMEEVQVDASQALGRTPLGYVNNSYTWDPRFVDGANLGAVRYDVAPDVEVQAEDDALAASWVPLSEIASGQRSVAFGHAAWLAEAFKDDERFGEQLAVVARLSEQRNQRVIKKVNGVRQGMGEPMIPERRGSWKPTTMPPKAKLLGGIEGAEQRFQKEFGTNMPDGDGDCYSATLDAAISLAASNPTAKIRVVHGVPLGTGGDAEGIRYGHAWVEIETSPQEDLAALLENVSDEIRSQMEELIKLRMQMSVYVIDRSNGKDLRLPKPVYYGIGNIDENFTRSYTVEEARQNAFEMGHYGPWE